MSNKYSLLIYFDSSYTGLFSYSWRNSSQKSAPTLKTAPHTIDQLRCLPAAFPQLSLQLGSHCYSLKLLFLYLSPCETSSASTLSSRANQHHIVAGRHEMLVFLKLVLIFDSHLFRGSGGYYHTPLGLESSIVPR